MVKGLIPTAIEESMKPRDLSCTYCGPGTWAGWDVLTEEDLVFVCDRHHAEMRKAKIIRLERRMEETGWKQINEVRETLSAEEYLDKPTDFKDNYEQRGGID